MIEYGRTSNYGRRIYIHEDSFTYLSVEAPAKAPEICAALVSTRAWRVIGHYVVDDALPIGRFRAEAADSVRDVFRSRWGSKMTQLLRAVSFAPADLGAIGQARPVLAADESIVASCSESGYLTFATTEASAVRMFADHVPLRTLRRKVAEQESDPEVADLTLIHGDALILPGDISAGFPAAGASGGPGRSFDIVHSLYRDTAVELLDQMASTLTSQANLNQEENQVVEQALGAAWRVILRDAVPAAHGASPPD